jgi:hypothetical protein
MRTPVALTWRRGRFGCAGIGPLGIAGALGAFLVAGWLPGVILAPGLTPDEATQMLRMHLMNQAHARMRDSVRAGGLTAPDRPRLQQLSDEIMRVREVRVRRVNVRPEIFWAFTRRSNCIARMELDGPAAEAPSVRYYRTACAWLTMPRIIYETTAARFRFPI